MEPKKLYTLEYSSNNSGGYWWLTDLNWKEMEANGWEVNWLSNDEFYKPLVDDDYRWLGALAKSATIQTDDPKQTIKEWEEITGSNAAALGCGCCGRPHSFTWTNNETGDYNYLDVVTTSSWS